MDQELLKIFRQNMDMRKLSFENVNIPKIIRELELDRLNFSARKSSKGKQTSISDFVN